MDEEQELAFKSIVFAQAFVDCIDELEGSSFYKHRVKQFGKSFVSEADKLLSSAYAGPDFNMGLVSLLEECHDAIEEVLESKVKKDSE